MDAITMGQRKKIDDSIIALTAAVFEQAATDYRFAVKWMKAHPDKEDTKEYKEIAKLRNDVIRFTKSDLFGLAIGDKVTPEMFLKIALKGHVRHRKRT